MPATEKKRFIPFRLLSPSHPEYAQQCSAYKKGEQRQRCTTTLKHDIPKIESLLGRLQNSHDTAIDDERESMWTELAERTICGHQRGLRTAAVQQWKSELQPQDSAAASQETPPRNGNAPSFDDRGSPKLEFTPYKTKNDKLIAQKLSCLLGPENREMSQSSNRGDNRGYLYTFECEDAEGMCKLGYTKNLPRRTKNQEKCYPNLTKKWVRFCPDPEVFERVLHLELDQYRYNHPCRKCNNENHTEWFKINLNSLIQRVEVWSLFSEGLQNSDQRSQVDIPRPGFSPDPDRWYKWAQDYVQAWDKKGSSEPNTSSKPVVDNAIMTGLSRLDLDDDEESVPELSPSSSVLGSFHDGNNDPPTPTPIEHLRNGKPILGGRLIMSMPPSKGRVLFPRVLPGADENELADMLGNTKLF